MRILCDPFLDQNPGALTKSSDFDQVDLVVVSHAAFDHLGDTDKIAAKYGCPVVCGGEVKAWLMDRGIPASQIRATTWGIRVKVAGIEIQPLECHHWSQIRLKDGSFISGVPMAFIVYADGNLRFYHYGDTAIFSDLKLQAELYKPNVGCIGIANPQEILHLNPMPGEMLTGEMSPYEGVLATQWLGLETVLPCHYITLDGDKRRRRIHEAPPRGESARRQDRRPLSAAEPATGSSSTRPARSLRPATAACLMRAAIFDAPFRRSAWRMSPSRRRGPARCWSG